MLHYCLVGMMEFTNVLFFDIVREQLADVEHLMRASPSDAHPNLAAAIEHLLSSGGKRVRPTIVLLVGNMLGAPPRPNAHMAAAVEMLHTATLVHDDLIDGARFRRGIPTLNAQWTPGATVLTGDYLFAHAASLASRTGSLVLMGKFSETLMKIVNGEITQLFHSRVEKTREAYYNRIYAKTASLFQLSAEGPAILSGVGGQVVQGMKEYGRSIGLAFQIVDDVLDFTGDQARVGKPIGSDLRQGLITLPSLCYLELHPEDPDMQAFLAGDRLDQPGIDRLLTAIRSSGSIEKAMEEAAQLVEDGISNLSGLKASPEREALHDLAQYVVRRSI